MPSSLIPAYIQCVVVVISSASVEDDCKVVVWLLAMLFIQVSL